MKIDYINTYNNLINLSRNKNLYLEFTKNDTFFDRLMILLLHFAFFLKNNKNKSIENINQEIYDVFFNNLEINIREVGYGDTKINKKMKIYNNLLFSILDKIEPWNDITTSEKESMLSNLLETKKKPVKLTNYFDRFDAYLKKTPLNCFLKGVINHKF